MKKADQLPPRWGSREQINAIAAWFVYLGKWPVEDAGRRAVALVDLAEAWWRRDMKQKKPRRR